MAQEEPLDPAIAALLPNLTLGPQAEWTVEAFRDRLRAAAEAKARFALPQVSSVEDRALDLPGRRIPIRVYRPSRSPSPTILYFHGGGWIGGDLDTQDRLACRLSIDAEAVVVSVGYRRPPEHPVPAAIEDAVDVLQHVAGSLDLFGGDPSALGVAGDSAGANIAAALCLATRGQPAIAAQFLVYPATDLSGGYRSPAVNARYPSRQTNGDGYYLTTAALAWFVDHYAPDEACRLDPLTSPMLAERLDDLPPAVICTAAFDPLRDEGLAYGRALAAAGVPVVEFAGAGLIHGFFGLEELSPRAAEEARRARAAFASVLAFRSTGGTSEPV